MLLENIKNIFTKLAFYWIHHNSKALIKKYPQMCCFTYDYIGLYINCFGLFEKTELNELASIIELNVTKKVALDIGANIGNHTVFLSKYFEKVHAFEPNPVTYSLLEINTKNLPNVTNYMVGASCENANIKFLVDKLNIGRSHIVKYGEPIIAKNELYETTINVRSIDSFTELQTDLDVGFIKIDVEGNELMAIQGMEVLLKTKKPMIAFEQLADEIQDGTSDVMNALRNIGYSNFYSIEHKKSLFGMHIPSVIRRPLRALEILFLGDPTCKGRTVKIENIENRNYYMLIASTFKLEIPK